MTYFVVYNTHSTGRGSQWNLLWETLVRRTRLQWRSSTGLVWETVLKGSSVGVLESCGIFFLFFFWGVIKEGRLGNFLGGSFPFFLILENLVSNFCKSLKICYYEWLSSYLWWMYGLDPSSDGANKITFTAPSTNQFTPTSWKFKLHWLYRNFHPS